jgi:hypothetical protein
VLGFCIFSRKENGASVKVQMFYLNPYEFADATTEFIDDLEHKLVKVVVDAVKELPKFIDG